MQALCKQEAAASLNHLLGKQPQPLERGEVAEGLKQEGDLQHLVEGCKMIPASDIKEGTGCPLCSAEWDPEHPLASSSCSPHSVA